MFDASELARIVSKVLSRHYSSRQHGQLQPTCMLADMMLRRLHRGRLSDVELESEATEISILDVREGIHALPPFSLHCGDLFNLRLGSTE
jgi:hypothetical protein